MRTILPRPDWDEYYLGIAKAASLRGECTRSRVGAIIVKVNERGQHQTSIGCNGVEPGAKSCLDGVCPRGRLSYEALDISARFDGEVLCIAKHAEQNAVHNAAFPVEGATIYISRDPCHQCVDFLYSVGIEDVRWLGAEGKVVTNER